MTALPPALVAAISARIRDPGRRHDPLGGTPGGVVTDPEELIAMFGRLSPEAEGPFRGVVAQMAAWGQKMPPMHVTNYPDGTFGASSEDADALPLAAPASEADIATLERKIGRKLPADLRALYAIADGGWGPGTAYTQGRGSGFQSLEAVGNVLDDLRRRGPGYTGEHPWPAHLLPIADTTGPVSYNLDTGEIVAFNDYYFDDGQTVEEAFTVLHPSLAAWLEEWVAS
ncbi:SMI1/KNR4 family protein [Novosphingobium tardum]|uniref:SMI1/KNR4 family protein n=1 Tax=Novosphingobium tardum TaxID=1538021 RepID=A0ABV8RS67_9SPHN